MNLPTVLMHRQHKTPEQALPATAINCNPILIIRVWTVSLFHYEGVNETEFYKNLQFSFTSNGEVLIESDTSFFCGTWQFKNGFNSLVMNFPKGLPMIEKISKTWNVSILNSTDMRLMDTMDGTFDVLQFHAQ